MQETRAGITGRNTTTMGDRDMDKKDVKEIVEKIIAAIAASQSVREVVARGNFGSALERNIDALSKMTATSVITVS
jgi:hypothetical protein